MSHGGDRYGNKVKLDFSVNLNPLGISENIKKELIKSIEMADCYPDPENRQLTEKLSKITGIESERLVFGNGASELLMAICHAFKPKNVLLPVPSFTGYEHVIKAVKAETVFYYMKEENDFSPEEAVLEEIHSGIDMLFLTNPNNPTGAYIRHDLLDKILNRCREQGIKVVLDECFMELSDDPENNTFITDIDNHPELIILRAFTKSFAVPGVRLGYLTGGCTDTVSKIKEQLPERNVSVMAAAAGSAALECVKELSGARETIKKERAYLTGRLEELGFSVTDSKAGYLLFKEKKESGRDYYHELLKEGILIRDCSDYRGLSAGYMRVAIKTREENMILADAFKRLII